MGYLFPSRAEAKAEKARRQRAKQRRREFGYARLPAAQRPQARARHHEQDQFRAGLLILAILAFAAIAYALHAGDHPKSYQRLPADYLGSAISECGAHNPPRSVTRVHGGAIQIGITTYDVVCDDDGVTVNVYR